MFNQIVRLLTFRISREEVLSFGTRHLVVALLATWVVGMGRWWDDPKAELLQKLGIGSVACVLTLSLVLWLVAWPFRPEDWSYTRVLTFVGFTAPPAALYAIPVERMMAMETAAMVNLVFLLVVAVWRVALLVFFFSRYAALGRWVTGVVVLLPLCAIMLVLAFLNLARNTVSIMGGIRDPTADDAASGLVVGLGFLSYLAFVPVVIGYVVAIVMSRKTARREERIRRAAERLQDREKRKRER